MHFELFADFGHERHCQLTAEMLAKLLQAFQNGRLAAAAVFDEMRRVGGEADALNELQHTLASVGIQNALHAGVNEIHGHADGHGLAVRHGEFGNLLQLVGGPVAEIQRTGGTKLKRITAGGDVLDVQLGAALHDLFQRLLLQRCEVIGHRFDLLKEGGIANERDFDGLDDAVAAFARREGFEEGEVIHHRVGHGEAADPVFLPEVVHAVFDAYAAIALRERGGGKTHMPNAAMRRGGGEADQIEHRTATDDEDVAVTVQRGFIDGIPAALDEAEVVLAGLTTGQGDGRVREREGIRMHLAIGNDVVDQIAVRIGDGFIDENKHAGQLVRRVQRDEIPHGVVADMKSLPGEKDAVGVFEPDGSLQH